MCKFMQFFYFSNLNLQIVPHIDQKFIPWLIWQFKNIYPRSQINQTGYQIKRQIQSKMQNLDQSPRKERQEDQFVMDTTGGAAEAYHSPPFSPARTPQKAQPAAGYLEPGQSHEQSKQLARAHHLSAYQPTNNDSMTHPEARKAPALNANQSTGQVAHKKQNSKIIREKILQQQKNQQHQKGNNNSISQFSNASSMAAMGGANRSGQSSQFAMQHSLLHGGLGQSDQSAVNHAQVNNAQGQCQNAVANIQNFSNQKTAQQQNQHSFHFDERQGPQEHSSTKANTFWAPGYQAGAAPHSADVDPANVQHHQPQQLYVQQNELFARDSAAKRSPFVNGDRFTENMMENTQQKAVALNGHISSFQTVPQSKQLTTPHISGLGDNFASLQHSIKSDHEMGSESATDGGNKSMRYEDKENVNTHNSDKTKWKHQSVIKLIQEQQQQQQNSSRAMSSCKDTAATVHPGISQIHKSLRKQQLKQHPNFSSPHFFLDTSQGLGLKQHQLLQQPKVTNLKRGTEHKNLSEANLLARTNQSRGKSYQNQKLAEAVPSHEKFLAADKEYSRYVGVINKATAGGATAAGAPREAEHATVEPNSFVGMTNSNNLQMHPNDFKKFNLDEAFEQVTDQEQQMKNNEVRTSERENERNMQNLQQLVLGDSSSMERASERASDPDPEAAAKIVMQKKHQDAMLLEEENSSTANELTMNILNQHPKQDNLFSKEREYDQQALEAPEAGKPPLLAPLIVRPQHSESNALMRMNSCNEHTSSSLGKRNYNDFQKSQMEQKELKKISSAQKSQGAQLGQIDESEAIEKRIRKTPARRLQKKGIQRTNSDNFGVEQVHQSGKKLINEDGSHNNDDSSNLRIGTGVGGGFNLGPGLKSDVVMSSCEGENQASADLNIQNTINFQRMGHNGQSNQMFRYFDNIHLRQQQFSGNGSSFDNYNGNHSHSGYDINQECQACNHKNGQQSQVLQQYKQTMLQNQIPQGKETPNFIKGMAGAHCINNAAAIENFYKNKRQYMDTVDDGSNNFGAVTKILGQPEPATFEDQCADKQEIESAESEEDQFERENEDQSTMPQTDMVKTEQKKSQMMKFEVHQTINNVGQVVVNTQQQQLQQAHQQAFPQCPAATALPFGQPSWLQNQQSQQPQDEQVRRHLSFRSVSNSSSIIETPIQQKRIKQSSQNNSQNQDNRIFNMPQRTKMNILSFENQQSAMEQPPAEVVTAPSLLRTNLNLAMQKSSTTKEGGSPQSLVQRWRCSDPIFMNKFSSGATPPQKPRERISKGTTSSHQNNFQILGDETALRKVNSHYFKRPADQTMPTRGQHQFGGTMSPNELKILSADVMEQDSGVSELDLDNQIIFNPNNGRQRKFQIDTRVEGPPNVRQRLMFDEQSGDSIQQLRLLGDQRDSNVAPQKNVMLQTLTLKRFGKSNSTSCQNLLAQSYPNPPMIMNQVHADFQAAYQQNNNFFQTMNEKHHGNGEKGNSLLIQDKQILMSPEIINTRKEQSDLSRMNSRQGYSHVLHQNLENQQQSNLQTRHSTAQEPFQLAAQSLPFTKQAWPDNVMYKTQSSVSNSHSNTGMSIHTCNKHRSTITIPDGKSNGGPKTPVHNNHGLRKRHSLISGTNTSMNEQSAISSSLDTEGNQPYYKKNKRPTVKQAHDFSVNQFQGGQQNNGFGNTGYGPDSQSNAGLNLSSKTYQQQLSLFQQKQPAVSWLDKEFTRLSVLGKGHFGQVLKCQNNTDKFEYAIKVTSNRIRNPNEQAFYLQEMQTLSALSVEAECPHIVRYFNSWIEDDRIHIVMELCEKSLKQVKQDTKAEKKWKAKNQQLDEHQGYIPEEELRQIIRDVLLGLGELHSQDIVHLDIKPGNILKGKNNNYKLGDLGMARFLAKITEDINIPEGDCRYLAKELLSRDMLSFLPDLKKSDIFSLGITAYELITLSALEKNGPAWRALRDGSFVYPPEVEVVYSAEILDSIRRMLSENTDDRPSAAELLDSVFVSAEQRRIHELEVENARLNDVQQQLFDLLQQNGVNPYQWLQSLNR